MQLPESPGIFQYQLCTCLAHGKVQEDIISVWVVLGFFKGCFEGRCGTHLCE